ncbi:unnamed protein product [Closterium sp. Naga37s-1]|nr:unnamed protein product [Closterium sp. Naga37s-1]
MRQGTFTSSIHPWCEILEAAASAPPSFSYSRLNSSSPLLTSGSARLLPSSLRLTPLSPPHQAGLALHPTPFALVSPSTPTSSCRPYSFSSSFSFRLSSPQSAAALGADGFAFVLLPDPTVGLPGPNMGYGRRPYRGSGVTLNSSLPHQHSMAVEFDTSSTRLFSDPTTHHVGVNVDYSMTSASHASVHPTSMPSLAANQTLHAWVAYNATASLLSVRLSSSPAMPPSALLSLPFNACAFFHNASANGGEAEAVLVHAGFAAGTGLLPLHTQTHDILSWAFHVDTKAPAPLPVWQPPSLSLPFLTPAAPFTASGAARLGFSSLQLTPGNQDQESGAAFFPLPLPLLSLLPAPPPRKGRKRTRGVGLSKPSNDPVVCSARSFTSWFAFELKASGGNGFGVVFVISTRPGVGQGGAGMGYGSDAQGRNANGTWADGGRSVAVMFDAFSGIDPNHDVNKDMAILSVHTDFNVTQRLAFSAQGKYVSPSLYSMRVDYTAATKTLEAVTYNGAQRMGNVSLTLDLTDTCAPGVCLESYDASSFCLCPPAFFPLDYSNLLRRPCNPVRKSAVRVPFFPAPPGLTCPLLLDIFDLSPQELLESNQGLACHKPIPRGLTVNVSASANKSCTSMYTINQNKARYPSSPVAACNLYKTLDPTAHTCQQLAVLRPGWHVMSIAKLFRVNPALYFDHLLPNAAGWTDSVVDKCVTKRFYLVKRGDTCGKLIASQYKRKVDLFRSLNDGFDCTVSSLWVGMQLCLP